MKDVRKKETSRVVAENQFADVVTALKGENRKLTRELGGSPEQKEAAEDYIRARKTMYEHGLLIMSAKIDGVTEPLNQKTLLIMQDEIEKRRKQREKVERELQQARDMVVAAAIAQKNMTEEKAAQKELENTLKHLNSVAKALAKTQAVCAALLLIGAKRHIDIFTGKREQFTEEEWGSLDTYVMLTLNRKAAAEHRRKKAEAEKAAAEKAEAEKLEAEKQAEEAKKAAAAKKAAEAKKAAAKKPAAKKTPQAETPEKPEDAKKEETPKAAPAKKEAAEGADETPKPPKKKLAPKKLTNN